jgi:hypothetical protein
MKPASRKEIGAAVDSEDTVVLTFYYREFNSH